MTDKTNHERLEEEGLLTDEWPEHHQEAINSLSKQESEQLIEILKKVKSELPDGYKQDSAFVF